MATLGHATVCLDDVTCPGAPLRFPHVRMLSVGWPTSTPRRAPVGHKGHDIVCLDAISSPRALYDVMVHPWWSRPAGQYAPDDEHNDGPTASRALRDVLSRPLARYTQL